MCDTEKNMKNNFFISKGLRKDLERDMKKRDDIEEAIKGLQRELNEKVKPKISKDLEKFLEEIDDTTVSATFTYIEKHGNKKQQDSMLKLRDRYDNKMIIIEDTLNLMDWYEEMIDYYNNSIED